MVSHPNRSKHQRGARCIYRDLTASELDRAIDTNAELLAALKLVELRLNEVQSDHGTRANDLRDYLLSPVHTAVAKAEGR